MPQAELMTNEILVLIGIPLGLLFSDLSGDGGVDDSNNEYMDLFIEFAYETDRLCFYLDIFLQRLFMVIVAHSYLSQLSSLDSYSTFIKEEDIEALVELGADRDLVIDFYHKVFFEGFWDDFI